MHMQAKQIAIVGAGVSGLTAAKACLEQGLKPTIFERSTSLGGLWRFSPTMPAEDGSPTVMSSTIANTSKEISAFSDFPPPDHFPNFMPHDRMLEYFELYARKFDLEKTIHYEHEVVTIEPTSDFDLTGRWRVVVRHLRDSSVADNIYDGVMVATGHHCRVHYPEPFQGQSYFRGRIVHSHDLKDASGFHNLDVVVVGLANSGADAAVEISLVAKNVYASTRRGAWIMTRMSTNGRPLDQYLKRRFLQSILGFFPTWVSDNSMEFYLNTVFNHSDYQLKPSHRFSEQHPVVNDLLAGRIMAGKLMIRANIDHFTEDGVVFVGETDVTKADVVVFATGYKIHFPFLSKDIVDIQGNHVHLYRNQFVPSLARPETLAFIALGSPNGPFYTLAEIQSRWYAMLMVGRVKLPNVDQMEREIKQRLRYARRYYQSPRHANEMDWLSSMDAIAKDIGAMPPIWSYLLSDWPLFKALFFGAAVPYQYRLVGPQKWEGARAAVLGVQARIDAGFATRKDANAPKPSTSFTKYLHTIYWIQIGWVTLVSVIVVFVCQLIN